MPYIERNVLPFDPRLPARFWRKVEFTTDGCWIWTACASPFGYGHAYHAGKYWLAHRLAYTMTVGPIRHTSLDHLCRVVSCVNPAHLEDLPVGMNVKRGLGPPAVNSRKTECNRGHALSGDNLAVYRYGNVASRHCVICDRERSRLRRISMRAETSQGERHGR